MPRGGFFTSSDVSWMSFSSDRMLQNTVANRPRHFVIWTVLPTNVNVSGSWLAPACLFLRSMLKPIQDSIQRTVSSSNEFLGSLSRQAPEDYETAIIDAKNLCLSISWDHLTSVLTIAVCSHYSRNNLADFIVRLLNVILRNQFVLRRSEFFQT